MIAALIRTVFAQPDGDSARTQLRAVVDQLAPYAPTVAERLEAVTYTTRRDAIERSESRRRRPAEGDNSQDDTP